LALVIIVQYCKDFKSCYKYIVFAGLINIVVFLFQHLGFSPILKIGDATSMGAIIGNRPRFAMYLCLIIPFFYDRSRWYLIPLLGVTAIIAPNEFNILTALLLFLLMSNANYIWTHRSITGRSAVRQVRPHRYKIVAGIGAVTAVAVWHHHALMALQFRGVVWGQALTNFFNAPLYGLGLGVYPLGLEQMTTSKVDYAIYSSVLQFIICGGLLAIPLVYEGARRFVRHFSNSVPCKSLAILAVLCLYEYPLEITRLWITIIAIIGFFIIQTIKNPVIRQRGKNWSIYEYLALREEK